MSEVLLPARAMPGDMVRGLLLLPAAVHGGVRVRSCPPALWVNTFPTPFKRLQHQCCPLVPTMMPYPRRVMPHTKRTLCTPHSMLFFIATMPFLRHVPYIPHTFCTFCTHTKNALR